MTNPARYSPNQFYDAYRSEFGAYDMMPGDRIGPPRAARSKARRRGVLFMLMLLGGGSAMLGDPTEWSGWQWAKMAMAPPAADNKFPGTAARVAPMPPPVVVPPPLGPTVVAQEIATPPLATAALPPAATGVDAAPPAALPPLVIDPSDPYQKRAAAVGLHPELSRVLLERLSAADYRNAGIAIRTALSETDESAVFVWPRERKADLALFQVRFVPGATAECRRYVVTVSKDGWLTTALPMEKCGVQGDRPRRG